MPDSLRTRVAVLVERNPVLQPLLTALLKEEGAPPGSRTVSADVRGGLAETLRRARWMEEHRDHPVAALRNRYDEMVPWREIKADLLASGWTETEDGDLEPPAEGEDR